MRTLLLAPLLLTSACLGPNIRTPERDVDTTRRLFEGPLLIDLPPEEPAPEMHASYGNVRVGTGARYSLQFRGTPLSDVFKTLATEAGITLVPDESIDGTLDLDFHEVTVDEALATLTDRFDLSLVEGPGDIVYVERNDDTRVITEYFQLANVRAEDVAPKLEGLIAAGTTIVSDPDRNLLCVIGPRSDVQAIRGYLQRVDKLKQQVLVEVHIFEVSYEDGFQFGALHDVANTINGNAVDILSSFASGGGFSATLTDDDGSLTSTLDAVRSFVGLELISSPRILAVTNTTATVDVVQEIPYVQVTSTTSGTTAGVGATIQEEVQFKEAGIKLEITPAIQEAGFLQVDINQAILEEVGRFNDIPVVDRRTLTTQFLVADRETIVLGGLIQERHVESRRGIPILMHIPWLGQLFRTDDDRKRKQELLLFVTPRILSPGQAAKLAPHYRDSYREARGSLEFPQFGLSDGTDD